MIRVFLALSFLYMLASCSTTKTAKTPRCAGASCENSNLAKSKSTSSGAVKVFDHRNKSRGECRAHEAKRYVHPRPPALKSEDAVERRWRKKLIKAELLGLSIQDALVSIGEQTGMSISAAADLDGVVVTEVKGMKIFDALNAILRTNGADWRFDPKRNILFAALNEEGSLGREQILSTYVTKAKFIDAKAIVETIHRSYRDYVKAEQKSGHIKIVAPNGIMARLYDEIKKIDRQPAQVLLDLSIYEVDHSASLSLGRAEEASTIKDTLFDPINELVRASQVVLGSAASNLFLSKMRALSRDGRARVVSSPKAIVVDGRVAEFMTTETLLGTIENLSSNLPTNFNSTRFKEVSLKTGMRIRPVVLPKRRLMLNIENAESSTLTDKSRLGVKSHRLSTDVMIRSGRTLLLGGAIYEKDMQVITGVPFLKDLWLIGSLFSRKVKEKKRVKVIFSIRPEILLCEHTHRYQCRDKRCKSR